MLDELSKEKLGRLAASIFCWIHQALLLDTQRSETIHVALAVGPGDFAWIAWTSKFAERSAHLWPPSQHMPVRSNAWPKSSCDLKVTADRHQSNAALQPRKGLACQVFHTTPTPAQPKPQLGWASHTAREWLHRVPQSLHELHHGQVCDQVPVHVHVPVFAHCRDLVSEPGHGSVHWPVLDSVQVLGLERGPVHDLVRKPARKHGRGRGRGHGHGDVRGQVLERAPVPDRGRARGRCRGRAYELKNLSELVQDLVQDPQPGRGDLVRARSGTGPN